MRVMYDSTDTGLIPRKTRAVALYLDGHFRNWTLPWLLRFRRANKLSMTVWGNIKAQLADCEPGNLDAVETAQWVRAKLHVKPRSRPVVYGSRDLVISGGRRYGIPAILEELAAIGIRREQIRIGSAHYGHGPHICSPTSCGAAFTANGTQWTNRAIIGGVALNVDEWLLEDDFFPPAPHHIPKPHPKVAAATIAAAVMAAITIALHKLGIPVTPAEANLISAAAALVAGTAKKAPRSP